MGMGIILSALSAGGNSAAQSVDMQQKVDAEHALMQQRAALEEQKAKAIAQAQQDIKDQPINRAAALVSQAYGTQVPDTAQSASASPSAADAPASGSPSTSSPASAPMMIPVSATRDSMQIPPAMQAKMDTERLAILRQELRTEKDPENQAALLRDIDRTKKGIEAISPPEEVGTAVADSAQPTDSATTAASAAVKMRDRTHSEALQVAIQDAAKRGDGPAMSALQDMQRNQFMANGYSGMTNVGTGEQVGTGAQATRVKIAEAKEAGLTSRAELARQTKLEVMNAKAAGTYKDPSTIQQNEKDLWLHQYIAGNGAVPRSAPPWVKNNIGTWAAEKGITPDDLSSGMAQTKYDAAAANTAGHRAGAMAGVEAVIPALANNAMELSDKLDQGKFVPINKLMQMTETQISDPALSAFRVANQALISEYQQVISRGGSGNVTALHEAMSVLNGATNPEAYRSAVQQVKQEVAMNTAGMKTVRAELGAGSKEVRAAPSATKAGLPSDISHLLDKYK